MRQSNDNRALRALRAAIAKPPVDLEAVIDTSALPYRAEFIADPFIRRSAASFHILCEVYVEKGDKRIAHLASEDLKTWKWVDDVIVGRNVAFPAVYETGAGECAIVPQLGAPDERRLTAFRYELKPGARAQESWSVDLNRRITDRLIVTRPGTGEEYVIFGSPDAGRSALWVSSLARSSDGHVQVGRPERILRRGVFDVLANWMTGRPKLTFRPAGDLLGCDDRTITLPLQATVSGRYGECIAVATLEWGSWELEHLEYMRPSTFNQTFRYMHHLSSVITEREIVFCGDSIAEGPGRKWELFVFRVPLTELVEGTVSEPAKVQASHRPE